MAKKKTLRELSLEAFKDRQQVFDQIAANQKAIAAAAIAARKKREEQTKHFEAMLNAIDGEMEAEVAENREVLAKLTPIDPTKSPPPTRRAAYSDRMAALMSKLCFFTYTGFEHPDGRDILDRVLNDGGLTLKKTYNEMSTEAYLAEADNYIVVAFRGTNSDRDVKTDLDFATHTIDMPAHPGRVEGKIRVHKGFYNAYKHIEAQLRQDLLATADPANPDKSKPIYFTGHSLGGALAVVASAALGVGQDGTNQEALKVLADRFAAVYTFGSPRVGDIGFDNIVKAPHYRVVNRFDFISLTPPNWLNGYRHTGDVRLLRAPGQRPLTRPSGGTVTMLNGLASVVFSMLQMKWIERHHSISNYVAKLDEIAERRSTWH